MRIKGHAIKIYFGPTDKTMNLLGKELYCQGTQEPDCVGLSPASAINEKLLCYSTTFAVFFHVQKKVKMVPTS